MAKRNKSSRRESYSRRQQHMRQYQEPTAPLTGQVDGTGMTWADAPLGEAITWPSGLGDTPAEPFENTTGNPE